MKKLNKNNANVVAAVFFLLAGIFGFMATNYITAVLFTLLAIIYFTISFKIYFKGKKA